MAAATYRQGPYLVEVGFATIDQDGEQAHQETFADTPEGAARLLERAVGFGRYDTELEVWRPGPAVRAADTNADHRTVSRVTVVPAGAWDCYGDPYAF